MILDLFSGPRGWSEGLRQLGLRDVGIEIDRWACATAAAAGHATIRADVATYPTEPFRGRVEGLIASPPCQDFSRAGKRRGLTGDTGRLVYEVMRWSEALRPIWIACEQVPDVLPIWHEFAWRLRHLGYSAWAGVLCAADYGVPQTRERAFLLAHRERAALPPEPSHCRGGRPPGLFVPELLPWVSMAEALGWPVLGLQETENRSEVAGGHVDYLRATDRPAPTVVSNADRWVLRGNQIPDRAARGYQQRPVEQPAQAISTQAHLYRWELRSNNSTQGGNRPEGLTRSADEPALTVDSMAMQWTFVNGNQPRAARRRPHEPAPTIHWVAERPATTVCADPRIGRPGHKDREAGEQQFAEESVRVSIEEAAILQGFRPDYPFQGTKTKRFEQVGNAVPPPLAAAIVGALR